MRKSVDEVLNDSDALANFLSFMKSVNAEHLVNFWLDAESFKVIMLFDLSPPCEGSRNCATRREAKRDTRIVC